MKKIFLYCRLFLLLFSFLIISNQSQANGDIDLKATIYEMMYLKLSSADGEITELRFDTDYNVHVNEEGAYLGKFPYRIEETNNKIGIRFYVSNVRSEQIYLLFDPFCFVLILPSHR